MQKDQLISLQKENESQLRIKIQNFNSKKEAMLNELKKQKEKWDKALADRAIALDNVKEEKFQVMSQKPGGPNI